jgi:hypothetical protein
MVVAKRATMPFSLVMHPGVFLCEFLLFSEFLAGQTIAWQPKGVQIQKVSAQEHENIYRSLFGHF